MRYWIVKLPNLMGRSHIVVKLPDRRADDAAAAPGHVKLRGVTARRTVSRGPTLSPAPTTTLPRFTAPSNDCSPPFMATVPFIVSVGVSSRASS